MSLHARLAILIVITTTLLACTQQQEPPAPDPQTLLQAIPAASSAEYEHIRDMKTWRNPYLIVRSDGVALYDVADHAEIRLKPDQLLPHWPSCRPRNGRMGGWSRPRKRPLATRTRMLRPSGATRESSAACCKMRTSP